MLYKTMLSVNTHANTFAVTGPTICLLANFNYVVDLKCKHCIS